MVENTVIFAPQQAVGQFVDPVLPGEAGKGTDSGLVQHAAGTGKGIAFPTAILYGDNWFAQYFSLLTEEISNATIPVKMFRIGEGVPHEVHIVCRSFFG